MLNKVLAIKDGLIPADTLYVPSAVGILVAAKDARILICQVCEPARLPDESELGLLIRQSWFIWIGPSGITKVFPFEGGNPSQ